ncbi:MAG: hypothetical protein ACOY6K_04855 [Pseudomonadota bacterium]
MSVSLDKLNLEAKRLRREKENEFRDLQLSVKGREMEIKEREVRLKEQELEIRRLDIKRPWLSDPRRQVLAGALIAGLFTAFGAVISGAVQVLSEQTRAMSQQRIERSKADSQLILEMIKTNNNAEAAKANLEFVIASGLIEDKARRAEIADFLRRKERPPSLPSSTPTLWQNHQPTAMGFCALPSNPNIDAVAASIAELLNKTSGLQARTSGFGPMFRFVDAGVLEPLTEIVTFEIQRRPDAVSVEVRSAFPGALLFLGSDSSRQMERVSHALNETFGSNTSACIAFR